MAIKQFGTTATPSTVTLSATTAGLLLQGNMNRMRFAIYNPTSANLYIRLGNALVSATAGQYDYVVPTNQWIQSDLGEWPGSVYGYSVGGGTFNVSETT